MYPLLMICLIFMYPLFMICLIVMFSYILFGWSVQSVLSGRQVWAAWSQESDQGSCLQLQDQPGELAWCTQGDQEYEDTYLFKDLCNILQDKIQGIGIHSIDKHWFYFADDKQVIFSNTRRGRIKKTLLSLKKIHLIKKIFNI